MLHDGQASLRDEYDFKSYTILNSVFLLAVGGEEFAGDHIEGRSTEPERGVGGWKSQR